MAKLHLLKASSIGLKKGSHSGMRRVECPGLKIGVSARP